MHENGLSLHLQVIHLNIEIQYFDRFIVKMQNIL